MKSRVTTRYGDSGNSRSLGGDVVPKNHPIMECTGAVDSVRAHAALLRLRILEAQPPEHARIADFLHWVLHCTFLVGTECSDPAGKHPEYRKQTIGPEHLRRIETEQAALESALDLPKAFIVSASNPLAAEADLTATVVRTLERRLLDLKAAVPEFEIKDLAPFTNRLSDYFFVLARHLDQGRHQAVDYGCLERGPASGLNGQATD